MRLRFAVLLKKCKRLLASIFENVEPFPIK
jgi:hypothetical protein